MFFTGINHNCFDSPQVGNVLLQVGTHKNEENYRSCSLLCVCVWFFFFFLSRFEFEYRSVVKTTQIHIK